MTIEEQTPHDLRREPSDEEINEAVAKLLGWTARQSKSGSYWLYRPDGEQCFKGYSEEATCWKWNCPNFCSPDAPHSLIRQVLQAIFNAGEDAVLRFVRVHRSTENPMPVEWCIYLAMNFEPRSVMEAALRACGRWKEGEWR